MTTDPCVLERIAVMLQRFLVNGIEQSLLTVEGELLTIQTRIRRLKAKAETENRILGELQAALTACEAGARGDGTQAPGVEGENDGNVLLIQPPATITSG